MFKRSVIAMACIFALSACGGGGGGSPDVKSADRCQNLPPLLFLKKRQRQRKMRHRQVLKDRARHPHKAVKIWRRFRKKIQAMAVRQQRTNPKMKTRGRKMICRKMPPIQIV